jgi:hypothetical protein
MPLSEIFLISTIPTTFVLPYDRVDVFALLHYLCICPLGRSLALEGRRKKRSALGLANATAIGERARSLWNLESGLLPVAMSSNISRIVH